MVQEISAVHRYAESPRLPDEPIEKLRLFLKLKTSYYLFLSIISVCSFLIQSPPCDMNETLAAMEKREYSQRTTEKGFEIGQERLKIAAPLVLLARIPAHDPATLAPSQYRHEQPALFWRQLQGEEATLPHQQVLDL